MINRNLIGRILHYACWLLFLLWLPAQWSYFEDLSERGRLPIDFLTYQRAAEALEDGQSPYLSPAQIHANSRRLHQLDQELRAAYARGEGREAY